MHQQQQNIIHAISYDNAQSTKIERPAPLSLHLKLHWNYNQQLLQGKGRENKGREMLKKNKIQQQQQTQEDSFHVTQKSLLQAFSGSLDTCSRVVTGARICWALVAEHLQIFIYY